MPTIMQRLNRMLIQEKKRKIRPPARVPKQRRKSTGTSAHIDSVTEKRIYARGKSKASLFAYGSESILEDFPYHLNRVQLNRPDLLKIIGERIQVLETIITDARKHRKASGKLSRGNAYAEQRALRILTKWTTDKNSDLAYYATECLKKVKKK